MRFPLSVRGITVPLALSLVIGLSAQIPSVWAAEKLSGTITKVAEGGNVVRVAGDDAFSIDAAAGGFTAGERQIIVERNLNNALKASPDRSPGNVDIVQINGLPVVRLGGKHVVTADSESAKAAGTTMGGLAAYWANGIKRGLVDDARVSAYLNELGGDYISNSPFPYRRARVEAARLNHAADLYREDLPMDLVSSDSMEDQGFHLMLKGQPDLAAAKFQEALARSPMNARAHYGLGTALLKKGEVEPAIRSLQMSRWLDPDDAEVHLALGQAFETLGRDREAIDQYKEAELLQPHNPEPYLYVADMREERNDIGKSVGELIEAEKIMPKSQYIRLRRQDQFAYRLNSPM